MNNLSLVKTFGCLFRLALEETLFVGVVVVDEAFIIVDNGYGHYN